MHTLSCTNYVWLMSALSSRRYSKWLDVARETPKELKQLVRDGSVGPGDMIQPPGASDWLYLVELPEL